MLYTYLESVEERRERGRPSEEQRPSRRQQSREHPRDAPIFATAYFVVCHRSNAHAQKLSTLLLGVFYNTTRDLPPHPVREKQQHASEHLCDDAAPDASSSGVDSNLHPPCVPCSSTAHDKKKKIHSCHSIPPSHQVGDKQPNSAREDQTLALVISSSRAGETARNTKKKRAQNTCRFSRFVNAQTKTS